VWGKYSAPLNHKPDITILPEINPPSEPGLNVVRWVLYFPGAIGGGPTTYPSHELVVSYHDAYNEAANAAATRKPILNFRLPFCEKIDLSQMPLSGPTRKIKNVVWYGKGPRIPCNDIHCAIEITREWPSKRNELLNVLQNTHIFYSYDEHTALNNEALLCGCTVFIWRENGFKQFLNPNVDENTMRIKNDLDCTKLFLEKLANIFDIGDRK
jgi:hypothetical protein